MDHCNLSGDRVIYRCLGFGRTLYRPFFNPSYPGAEGVMLSLTLTPPKLSAFA